MKSTGAVSAFMDVILSLPVDSSLMTELALVGVGTPGGDWRAPLELEGFRDVAVGPDARASPTFFGARRRFPRQS